MTLDDISTEWAKDSNLDKTQLDDSALARAKLHSKYYNFYIYEKMVLRKKETDYARLKLDKHEFFTQGHNEETRAKKWVLPAKGLIMKAELPMYMEADEDLIDAALALGAQQEKVDFLKSILGTIAYLNQDIRNAIDFIRFTHGN